jgi:hypothetical protein
VFRPPSYTNGTDVMIARSTDGGATFGTPVKLNDDATTNKWHWFGTFSVAPNGRLDAVWYDTRNAADNLQSQLFYSYSTDAGSTWAPNVAVTASFNPTEGWPQQSKIGDYITIVSDNTGGNVAFSATFNFNPTRGQHEQDVYYVRVFPGGGGGTPDADTYVDADTYRDADSYRDSYRNGNGNGYSYPKRRDRRPRQGSHRRRDLVLHRRRARRRSVLTAPTNDERAILLLQHEILLEFSTTTFVLFLSLVALTTSFRLSLRRFYEAAFE